MLKKTLVFLGAVLVSSAALAGISLPLDRPAEDDLEHALANRLLAIEVAGERLVVVGRRGHILVSDDQGASWRQQPVPVASDLVDSYFLSGQLGWVVGHDGVVLRTRDGGESWSKVLDGRQAAELIEAMLQSGQDLPEEAVFEYERFAAEGSDKPFLTVHFTDELNGIVLGAFNYAFVTRDGGQTWAPLSHHIDNPMGFHIYAAFEHRGTLYAVGEKGLLLRWDVESGRFVVLESPYEGSWFGGMSLGEQIVLFGLRGTVFYGSPDGGWRRLELGIDDSINNSVALADGTAVLVAQSGAVFRLDRKGSELVSSELGSSGGMPVYDVEVTDGTLMLVGSRGLRQLSLQNKQ